MSEVIVPASARADTTAETKRCPACAEEVRAEAIKCKHCGHRYDRRSHKAVASLVFGIVSASGIGTLLSLIFGHLALRDIRLSPETRGRGMAISGLVLGYLHLAFYACLITYFVSQSAWWQEATDIPATEDEVMECVVQNSERVVGVDYDHSSTAQDAQTMRWCERRLG